MKRFRLAVVMNLLVPGTGLMGLGRPWLGLTLAVWFGLGVEIAVCGALIAPATVLGRLTASGAAVAAVAWVVGQGFLFVRVRSCSTADLAERLSRPA